MTTASERAERLALEPMRAATPPAGFFKGTGESLHDIWSRRDLIRRLTRREIRAKYKDSVLGVLWSLLKPFVNLLIYVLVLGRIMGAERSIPDFAIYVFTGLTAWQLFSDIISTSTASIINNSGIIKKIQLPREIFPISAAGASLFNFLMQFMILVLAVTILPLTSNATPPQLGANLLYLPYALVLLLVWALTLGLALSALNVYLRDIQYLVEIALIVGMWASPIVYSWEMVTKVAHGSSWIEGLYLATPVSLVVMGFQRSMWGAGADQVLAPHLLTRMSVSLVIGLISLGLAQRLFAVLQRNFAQEL